MSIREVAADDGESIRDVAQRSMEASYSLSPSAIEARVEQWYSEETFEEKFDDDDVLFLVVERDDEVVAFSESVLVDEQGDILWLHVMPMYRGEGIGEELFEATVETLEAAGADTVRGLVLADNSEGNAFYEKHGLTKAGEGTVEIDGTEYKENIYVRQDPVGLEPLTTPDGESLFLDSTDSLRGSKASFHTVYSDPERETKYGYFCTNCELLVTSMDAMGRLECNECGNISKPTRWDSAYM